MVKKIFNGTVWRIFCIAIPFVLPVGIWYMRGCCNKDSTCICLLSISYAVIILAIGHILMLIFLHSFHERKVKRIVRSCDTSSLPDDEMITLRRFLSETFGGDLQLEKEYLFPNGFRSDLVAVCGRGRYPGMCFEVVNDDDAQTIKNAVERLKYVTGPFAKLTRCFILIKLTNGSYKLLEVHGSTTQSVSPFASWLREEIENSVESIVSEEKTKMLIYPILFLLLVVTPIIEVIAVLAQTKFKIPGEFGTLLVVWIGAFLSVFGLKIKSFEPKVSDLMARN